MRRVIREYKITDTQTWQLDPDCSYCLRASTVVRVFLPCCNKQVIVPVNQHFFFHHTNVTLPAEHTPCRFPHFDLTASHLGRLPPDLRRHIDCLRYHPLNIPQGAITHQHQRSLSLVPSTLGTWCWEEIRNTVRPLCPGCQKHVATALSSNPQNPVYCCTVSCFVHGRRLLNCKVLSHLYYCFAIDRRFSSSRGDFGSCEALPKLRRLDSEEE